MHSEEKLKQIAEAALLAAGKPLTLDELLELFEEEERPDRKTMRQVLQELMEDYTGRGIELCEVASGFRIQARQELGQWISRLWAERPPRYSRALLETLALIAYRQPITRGEIEEIRGVSVSTNIVKTLMEREWVRVVGQRDVPGRPSLYATTREFLDYFGMKSLEELPTLAEIRDLDSINRELDFGDTKVTVSADEEAEQPDTDEADADATLEAESVGPDEAPDDLEAEAEIADAEAIESEAVDAEAAESETATEEESAEIAAESSNHV